MHIRVLAVGEKQPAWVVSAFEDYAARLPRNWRFTLKAVPTANRNKLSADAAKAAEGEALLAEIGDSERMIALDEHGRQLSSVELSDRLSDWQGDGRDVCLVIGGPDGLSADCLARADTRWSLSTLTLPHGLARVVVAEQLYRAWSLQTGHPYHRA